MNDTSSQPANYRTALIAAAVLAASFALLYRQVIVKLVSDWANDDNYSHGFLIVPVALYFAWERRARLLLKVDEHVDEHGEDE